MLRIKSFLLATITLAAFLIPASAEQMSLSGTLKDINDGSSYAVTISPVVAPAAPVTEPTPIPAPPPVAEPPPLTSGAPTSWNDARFNGSASSGTVSLPSGGTLSGKTITTHAEPASIVMGGNSTLRKVRVGGASREGVRIGSGTYTIEDSWLEAKGSAANDDHADVIQSYAGTGGGGPLNLTVRNSTIRAYNTAATAGLFVADKVYGKVTLDNVIFREGPFGLALYSDVKTIDVYAKDVCFVGPFGWGRPIDFRNAGGKVVVQQWEGVNECTIDAAGKLTKVKAIPRP